MYKQLNRKNECPMCRREILSQQDYTEITQETPPPLQNYNSITIPSRRQLLNQFLSNNNIHLSNNIIQQNYNLDHIYNTILQQITEQNQNQFINNENLYLIH